MDRGIGEGDPVVGPPRVIGRGVGSHDESVGIQGLDHIRFHPMILDKQGGIAGDRRHAVHAVLVVGAAEDEVFRSQANIGKGPVRAVVAVIVARHDGRFSGRPGDVVHGNAGLVDRVVGPDDKSVVPEGKYSVDQRATVLQGNGHARGHRVRPKDGGFRVVRNNDDRGRPEAYAGDFMEGDVVTLIRAQVQVARIGLHGYPVEGEPVFVNRMVIVYGESILIEG